MLLEIKKYITYIVYKMIAKKVKVIIDYDGTLTYEERYVAALAKSALKDLAENILKIPLEKLVKTYEQTKKRILKDPQNYSWTVDNVPACYAYEGALLTNTVTTQTLILENKNFKKSVYDFYKNKKINYDPVVDCTNYLFHKHTHSLKPNFREKSKDVLIHFIEKEGIDPYILTCSLADKVAKNLSQLGIGANGFKDGFKYKVDIFDDTRQYEMDSSWDYHFDHPKLGKIQQIKANNGFSIDLRRPAYYERLKQIASDGSRIILTADMISLPGILPLLMGLDFILLKAVYTPKWAVDFVKAWDNGWVIDDISELPGMVDRIMIKWFLKSQL
ncbi:hypothetical protein ACFLZ1_01855 [Patescibacteria group bacterium]